MRKAIWYQNENIQYINFYGAELAQEYLNDLERFEQ